jgi:hypothetical protein
MRIIKRFVAFVLATVTTLVFFYATTILLSFVYELD